MPDCQAMRSRCALSVRAVLGDDPYSDYSPHNVPVVLSEAYHIRPKSFQCQRFNHIAHHAMLTHSLLCEVLTAWRVAPRRVNMADDMPRGGRGRMNRIRSRGWVHGASGNATTAPYVLLWYIPRMYHKMWRVRYMCRAGHAGWPIRVSGRVVRNLRGARQWVATSHGRGRSITVRNGRRRSVTVSNGR